MTSTLMIYSNNSRFLVECMRTSFVYFSGLHKVNFYHDFANSYTVPNFILDITRYEYNYTEPCFSYESRHLYFEVHNLSHTILCRESLDDCLYTYYEKNM